MRLEIRSPLPRNRNAIGGISGLVVTIDGKTCRLPDVCANQMDYRRAERCKIAVRPTMFNYHHVIESSVVTDREIEAIKSGFKKIQKEHSPELTSISFTPKKEISLSQDTRARLLELQVELGTTFIADVELGRNQSLDELRRGIASLDKMETLQIKSPSISLQCDAPGLFWQKAAYVILKSEHLRFNVQWGGYGIYNKNWLTLSEVLGRRIRWCNMVGISPRRTYDSRPPIRSNIAYGLKHGAHTFCFGASRFDKKKEKSYVLDGESWYYKRTQNSYEADVAQSLNVAHGELKVIGGLVGTPAFRDYYASHEGLLLAKAL